MNAEATIKAFEAAKTQNEKTLKALEGRLTAIGMDFVEKILKSDGLQAAADNNTLESFVKKVFPESGLAWTALRNCRS